MKLLCLGDIVGSPGRSIVKEFLSQNREKYDFVIANGENGAGGFGLLPELAEEILGYGVDLITMGNHVWDKRELYDYLDRSDRIVRPYNYPKGSPGKGVAKLIAANGQKISVINIQGNVFMPPLVSPFLKIEEAMEEAKAFSDSVVVDFHAETTSEKIAMGWNLDGVASLVYGTHTHVPTADERILPKGTGYVTDIGMCGGYDGVLGMKKDEIIKKFHTSMPSRFSVCKENVRMSGIEVTLSSGICKEIKRIAISMASLKS